MSNAAKKSQGAILEIGTTAANGLTDSYVTVGEIRTIGEFGPEAPVIDATALADAVRYKLKGIPDMGTMELSGLRDHENQGQINMLAAAVDNGDTPYNIRITASDKITGGGIGTRHLFKALVTKFKEGSYDVDGLIPFSATLAITGAITSTAAT